MSTTPDAREPAADRRVARTRRLQVNEDWAATAVGLIILALVLVGVISPDLVP